MNRVAQFAKRVTALEESARQTMPFAFRLASLSDLERRAYDFWLERRAMWMDARPGAACYEAIANGEKPPQLPEPLREKLGIEKQIVILNSMSLQEIQSIYDKMAHGNQ